MEDDWKKTNQPFALMRTQWNPLCPENNSSGSSGRWRRTKWYPPLGGTQRGPRGALRNNCIPPSPGKRWEWLTWKRHGRGGKCPEEYQVLWLGLAPGAQVILELGSAQNSLLLGKRGGMETPPWHPVNTTRSFCHGIVASNAFEAHAGDI